MQEASHGRKLQTKKERSRDRRLTEMLPYRLLLVRLRRWQIAFGGPIPLEDLEDGDENRVVQEATRRLWDRVVEMEATLDR